MYNWLYSNNIYKAKILFAAVLACYFILWITYNALEGKKPDIMFASHIQGSTNVSRRNRLKFTPNSIRSSEATSIGLHTFYSDDINATVHATLNDKPDYMDKTFKDVYRPGFEISLPNLCLENATSLAIVILIVSAPANFAFRRVLRKTEGYIPFGRQNNVPIAFMLGISNDANINQLVLEESATYNDVIVNRNNDTYTNLCLKTMAILEWFQTYCSKAAYVLKVDDDIAVNVKLLLRFVNKRIHTKNAIYGRLAINAHPNRRKRVKNYVSEKRYKDAHYPRYHYGCAYLMTSDVPAMLYKAALSQNFINVEDVFFTGIVAQQVGVRRVPAPEFLGFDSPKHWKHNKQNAITDYWDTSVLKWNYEEYQGAKRGRKDVTLPPEWKEVTIPADFKY